MAIPPVDLMNQSGTSTWRFAGAGRLPGMDIRTRTGDRAQFNNTLNFLARSAAFKETQAWYGAAKDAGTRVLIVANYDPAGQYYWKIANNSGWQYAGIGDISGVTNYRTDRQWAANGTPKDSDPGAYDVIITVNMARLDDPSKAGLQALPNALLELLAHEAGHMAKPVRYQNQTQYYADVAEQHNKMILPGVANEMYRAGLVYVRRLNGKVLIYGKNAAAWAKQHNYVGANVIVSESPAAMQKAMTQVGVDPLNTSYSTPLVTPDEGSVEVYPGGDAAFNVLLPAIGDALGATLGQLVSTGNVATDIAVTSVLRAVGDRVGTILMSPSGRLQLETQTGQAVDDSLASFGPALLQKLKAEAIGSVSSFLTAELGDVLGLEGFGAELFGTVSSAGLSQTLTKVLDNISGGKATFADWKPENLFKWDGSAIAGAVGSFLGAKLGSLVVTPQTSAAVVLSGLGSSVGGLLAVGGVGIIGTMSSAVAAGVTNALAFAGQRIASLIGDMVLPGVGTFIGFVIGALAGNLFGRKTPVTPSGSADTYLQVPNAVYQMGNVTTAGGGSAEYVSAIAGTARDTLNGLIGIVTGGKPSLVSNLQNNLQKYGYVGASGSIAAYTYVDYKGVVTKVASADEAVTRGVLAAIRDTQVIGGDIFAKRVIARYAGPDLMGLAGDLKIASDMALYKTNRAAINDLIAQDVHSQFAAGWYVTFQRSLEMGLDAWGVSDFNGGLPGFFQSLNLPASYTGLEDVQVRLISGALTLSVTANTTNAGVFSILKGAAEDGRSVSISNLLGAGLGFSGWDTNSTVMLGNNVIDATGTSGGVLDDNAVLGGISYTAGNDIIIGSGFADTIRGRKGSDWMDGGDGADTITAGQDDDVVLGGAGDDLIFGDLGNDYVSGGAGNDQHFGSDGNDTFSGKGGFDTMSGEVGDDLFIVNADGGATYDLMDGGAGSDTVSYERFTGGVAVNLAAGGYYGDAWTGVENLLGGSGQDNLTGDAAANVLRGAGGADTLSGQDGNDTVEGGGGADQLFGGTGLNTLSYASSLGAVSVDLAALSGFGGDAEGDVFSGFQNLQGSRGSDLLAGDVNDNRLDGLEGDDWIVASAGYDTYDGGAGIDVVDYANATSGVNVALGSALETAPVNGGGSLGMALGQSLVSIEGVSGSAYADQLTGGAGDQTYAGAGGADYLAGGLGSDTYVFGAGDGFDTVVDDDSGANVLRLTGLTYDLLSFGVGNGSASRPDLVVNIMSTGEAITIFQNFNSASASRNVIKYLNIDGAGQINLTEINGGLGGNDLGNLLVGDPTHWDWISGYGGDDVLKGAPGWEDKGNIFIGGRGADSITASTGNDQFVFEAGDGHDTMNDSGGDDTLVFGPGVTAGDVVYEITTDGDMYIGVRDAANPALTASQVSDYVRVVGGGIKYKDVDTGREWVSGAAIERISVGGAMLDVTKFDATWKMLPWIGGILPVIIDLQGDGLDLTSVADTDIALRGEDGGLFQLGWAGPTEGFLAVDRNGDGRIDRASEISFRGDKAGATTDLEGLAGWDSNGDGKLDNKDARWDELLVWTDKDQNGQSGKGELQTAAKAGVGAIDLAGRTTGNGPTSSVDNFVANTTTVTMADGRALTAYDVALAYRPVGGGLDAGAAVQGDGVFGALLNDPASDAKTRGLPGSPDVLKGLAKLDFTGSAPNTRALTRWADRLAGKAAKPGEVTFKGGEFVEALSAARRVTSTGTPAPRMAAAPESELEPVLTPVGDSVAEPEDVVGVPASMPSDAEPWAANGDTTARRSDVAADAFDRTVAPDASTSLGWWRLEAAAAAHDGGFRALLGQAGAASGWTGATPATGGDPVAGHSIDALHQQQLLRQAVAGFGGEGGGSAAVWTRKLATPGADLAAVQGDAGWQGLQRRAA